MDSLATALRPQMLQRMAQAPLDVLVIGGGVTGVGVALDAALRGLRVAIVERDDWACGTSSRSSKMVHGGLRYLANGDPGLVREALRERAAIQRNARHLVRPLPMMLPVWGGPLPWQRIKLGTGLWIYDMLGAWRANSRHRWLSVREVTRKLPGILPTSGVAGRVGSQRLRGGLAYFDAQADDVRLVLSILREAVSVGAMACNGAEVTELLRDADGTVTGARVSSDVAPAGAVSGGSVDLHASVVVNATGVWAGQLAGDEVCLRPSKGIHLTVRRDRVGIESGVAFFEQTGNSNVFLEPWQDDLAFVGTTDDPYDGDLESPEATEGEIAWLLEKINQFLRHPLTRDDVIATWAGLRPLVLAPGTDTSVEAGETKEVSRKHLTAVEDGLVTITGGKLTTWRSMAEDAVDFAVKQIGETGFHGEIGPCRTLHRELDGCTALPSSGDIDLLASQLGVERAVARHLHRRYGSRCDDLAALIAERPELAQRIHPDRPTIGVEVVWAARAEQARDVEDVLTRRTRLAIETSDAGEAARVVVEALLETEAALVAEATLAAETGRVS